MLIDNLGSYFNNNQQSIRHNRVQLPAASIFGCFPIAEELESRIASHLR